MITFAPFPIPVVTPLGSGYIVYVSRNPIHENDEITVAMDEDGQYRHFNAGQVKAYKNATYGINAGPSKEDQKPERNIPHEWEDTREKKEWNDLLVSEFCGYLNQRFVQGGTPVQIPDYMHQFKEKHNIK